MTVAVMIEKAWLMLIGLSVGGGALYLIYFRDSHYWRYLGEFYESPWNRPMETRHFQHAVAYGEGFASKSYNGLLTIGVHELGLALRILPPFSFFHKPLFIPYSEIKGWTQLWYLNSKSYELEFQSAPNVKLVMPASQIKWLQEKSQGQMEVINKHSRHKQRPNIWYAIIILQGLMGFGLLLYLVLGYGSL
ncbi:MAG: hypothetical protein GY948_08070 [Alphaproteobacteria bacterium]|nr:hypothetical protein [Alphaproteobacteria bacterium]